MSSSVSEKISILRGFLDLTRIEFSESIGVSVNTLKAIEQKGVTPKSDVLIRIAKTWPKYANWLLLGDSSIESLISEDQPKENYTIIDSVDVRFIDKCIVKNERLKQLIFLQSKDTEDLAALLIVDQPDLYSISDHKNTKGAVWLRAGNMNLSRNNGGGWSVLRDFRNWLMEVNSDLVQDSGFYNMNQSVIDKVYKRLVIEKEALEILIEDVRYENFLKWKEGEGY